jgi:ribosomal protein S18 acetylase RimI-like enzyme
MILSSALIFLRPVTRETALLFKDVRLRALEDVPLAFSSTYAKESQLPNEEWIRRTERWTGETAILYLAFDDADQKRACGIVACYAEEENGVPRGHVISMWVDPAYRRAGAGRLLIQGLKDWAEARGLRALKLMVTSVNQGAIDFYDRLGFRMTGITGPYPHDPAIIEYEMVLPLDR